MVMRQIRGCNPEGRRAYLNSHDNGVLVTEHIKEKRINIIFNHNASPRLT